MDSFSSSFLDLVSINLTPHARSAAAGDGMDAPTHKRHLCAKVEVLNNHLNRAGASNCEHYNDRH